MKRRQILLVYCLGRIGKTTMMMQVISSLLKFVPPRHILYFSFDELTRVSKRGTRDLSEDGSAHQFRGFHGTDIHIFCEIQKQNGWDVFDQDIL